ncbi:MAG: DNA-binding protein [Magnetococcales bacterium]|nr:DNA-binding protein [Magnetococcales bacterium]
MQPVQAGNIWIDRLPHDSDLLEVLNALCRARDIRLGRIEGLGAVRKARLGFYDQARQVYEFLELDQPLEITNLVGNVSLKEGEPFVHVHLTLADHAGRAFGGHLAPGTVVFAAEVMIQELTGAERHRGWDATTGLPLWDRP